MIALVLATLLAAPVQDTFDESQVVKEEKVKEKVLPEAVLKAFKAEANRSEGRMNEFVIKTTKSGRKFYEVELKLKNGAERDYVVDAEGNPSRVVNEDLGLPSETFRRDGAFQDKFDVKKRKFSPSGRNRYFILEPGYQLTLEGKQKGVDIVLIITVLDQTKTIDGIECRIVEERESENGELIEVSRNFMAFCTESKSIFYFGEEVDDYKDGKIVGHGGAWIAGKDKARAGILMPGEPVVGAKYHQETAPEIAMDRAEIKGFLKKPYETPAGAFKDCVVVEESTPLEPGVKEFKIHAPGIGLVFDGGLKLTKYGFLKK